MRPKQVANRPLVLLLVAMVAGATLLAAFHHHSLECSIGSESGHPDRSLGGDCVVCRLAEPKSFAIETPQAAPAPSLDSRAIAEAPARPPVARPVAIRASRAPPRGDSNAS